MTGVEIAAGLAAAGALTAAVGTYSAGQSQANSSEYNAKVAEQTAKVEQQRAAEASRDFMKRQRLALGTARANRAASGVDLLSGSAFAADQDLVNEIALQNERILRGGQVAATRAQQQANLSRTRGKSASTAGMIGAGSTLLTGASQYYG